MRVLFEQIEKFSVKILSPKLWGFRKSHSTQHALLNLLKNWQKTLGNWPWAVFWVLICTVHLTVCSCNVTYFRSRACFEQGVPWHLRNYRVWIYSEMRTCRALTRPYRGLSAPSQLKLAEYFPNWVFPKFLNLIKLKNKYYWFFTRAAATSEHRLRLEFT